MPFDVRTINANLDAAWAAQRSIDKARVGLKDFESVRTALDRAGLYTVRRAGVDAVSAQIRNFGATRSAAERVWDATGGIKEAIGGIGSVPLARGLASITFPTAALKIPKPEFDLKIPSGVLGKLAVPSASASAVGADPLRLRTEGVSSPMLKAANVQPVLGNLQALSEIVVQPRFAGPLVQPGWVTAMASAVTGRGLSDALRSSGFFEATRAFQGVSGGFFNLSEALAPYFETVGRAARGFAEQTDS